ncbi:hypothetical protein ACFX13_033484 [Malus domestica]
MSNSTDELNALAANVVPLIFADGSDNGGPSLYFPNGLWVDESLNIKPSFKVVVDVFYKAVANKVNFKNKAEEVRIEVNSWAKEKTGGGEEEGKPLQQHFSMYIILPIVKDGLPALLDKVCSDNDFLNQHQPYRKVEVGDLRVHGGT